MRDMFRFERVARRVVLRAGMNKVSKSSLDASITTNFTLAVGTILNTARPTPPLRCPCHGLSCRNSI